MNLFYLYLATLLLLLSPATTPLAEPFPIAPFDATYEVKRNGLSIGKAQRKLYRQDDLWVFENSSHPTGIAALFVKDRVTERSYALFEDGRMLPQDYLYRREGGKREREVKMHFDWSKNRVINTVNSDPWVMKIPPDTLDKFIYQLQMMLDLESHRSLEYQIADGGRLKQYRIEVIGSEKLKTPIGSYEAIILQRTSDKRVTTMWCAKALNYLPIKISQIEKGDTEYLAEIILLNGLKP